MRSEKPLPRLEAQLAELARRDAQRLTPAFSESIHDRIMQSVESDCQFVPPGSRSSSSMTPPVRLEYENAQSAWKGLRSRLIEHLVVASAAAIVVIAISLPSLSSPRQKVGGLLPIGPAISKLPPIAAATPRPKNNVPTLNDVTTVFKARVQEVVQTAMAEQQYQDLDHDVRLATHYLVDQVPLRSAWLSDDAKSPQE